MTAHQFEVLLRTSLDVWCAQATLQAAGPAEVCDGQPQGPLRATLALRDGRRLTVVEAAADEAPFRWWLLWNDPAAIEGSADAVPLRRKPCASTLGLLRSLREALGVPAAGKVRIGTGAGRGAAP